MKTQIIDPDNGVFCKTCKNYYNGTLEENRNHRCRKITVRKKYMLFGKQTVKIIDTDWKPELMKINEVNNNG